MVSSMSMWDLFRWFFALTALWLVASIPGYWLFSAWSHLRLAVNATFDFLVNAVAVGRARRHHLLSTARDELMDRVGLFEVSRAAADAWQQTLAIMLEGVRAGSTQIQATREAAVESTKQLERIARQARTWKLASAALPAVPAIDEVLQRARRNRSAAINLVASVGLFIPIAVANAQLTGLVLQETIPPVQPILRLPVAYVIALVIVIAEAAVGLLHSAEADAREGSGRRLTVLSVVWTMAAIGVVAIEAMLYSRVQTESGFFRLPFGVSAFGLVGALLGLSVFGLGA